MNITTPILFALILLIASIDYFIPELSKKIFRTNDLDLRNKRVVITLVVLSLMVVITGIIHLKTNF